MDSAGLGTSRTSASGLSFEAGLRFRRRAGRWLVGLDDERGLSSPWSSHQAVRETQLHPFNAVTREHGFPWMKPEGADSLWRRYLDFMS